MKKKVLLLAALALALSLIVIAGARKPVDTIESKLETCSTSQEGLNCWETGISEVLKEKGGVGRAFEILKNFREKNLAFSSDCHVYAHLIGEVAYWDFIKNGKVNLDNTSTLCAYGFYHGFMLEFGHHGGERFLKEAAKTCDELTSQLGRKYEENSSFQCYHGIGHGLVFYDVDKAWPNELEFTKLGIEACKGITGDETKRMDCVYGVYGGIASLYFGTHGYRLPMREDPVWLCHFQPEVYKEGCYTGMVPPVWIDRDFNIGKTLEVFEKLSNWRYAASSVQSVGHAASHKMLLEPEFKEKAVKACQGVKRGLNIFCIEGLAQGVFLYSLPKDAYQSAVDFCQSSGFTRDEVKKCFEGIIETVKSKEPERKDFLCSLVAQNYQDYCHQGRMNEN